MGSKSYLITGSAGFIGFHLATRLLRDGHQVVGLDDLNSYYSPELKRRRRDLLQTLPGHEFFEGSLGDSVLMKDLFHRFQFDSVFHLAAQVGVRHALDHPHSYLKCNVEGTLNVLEAARLCPRPPQLLLASSSSVYGLSRNFPTRETDASDLPASLYGATKRTCELMAHSYSHLHGLRTTLMRIFTAYGPWGRPDMAMYLFTRKILEGGTIQLFNGGELERDFTYIDDVVDAMIGLESHRDQAGQPPYDVFNIGSSRPHPLIDLIRALEKHLGRKARTSEAPHQAGDVYKTHADISKISAFTGFAPTIDLDHGVGRFVDWYCRFHESGRGADAFSIQQ